MAKGFIWNARIPALQACVGPAGRKKFANADVTHALSPGPKVWLSELCALAWQGSSVMLWCCPRRSYGTIMLNSEATFLLIQPVRCSLNAPLHPWFEQMQSNKLDWASLNLASQGSHLRDVPELQLRLPEGHHFQVKFFHLLRQVCNLLLSVFLGSLAQRISQSCRPDFQT